MSFYAKFVIEISTKKWSEVFGISILIMLRVCIMTPSICCDVMANFIHVYTDVACRRGSSWSRKEVGSGASVHLLISNLAVTGNNHVGATKASIWSHKEVVTYRDPNFQELCQRRKPSFPLRLDININGGFNDIRSAISNLEQRGEWRGVCACSCQGERSNLHRDHQLSK